MLIWLGLGARPSPTIVIPGEATEGSDFVRRNRRCRIDGSEKLQLTSAPLSTGAGRWSPDGRQLAFSASAPGTAGRLYLVSAEETPNYVVFSCRLTAEEEPIKLGVPFRAFEEQVEERMNRIDLYKDLPRGRKRPGWKKEFLESLTETARDIGEISEEEILRTVRTHRKERRAPEITVAAEN